MLGRAVFVVDACRTPVGKYGGRLATVRADDLAALPIAALLARNTVDPQAIDEVVLGCANQSGEDNRNVARMAALLAGLPFSVPAHTINRLCASGLDAVNAAARMIALGEADVAIAGGVESMSRAPWSVPKPHTEPPRGNNVMYDTALGWRYPNPKLEARFALEQMGETAENLVDRYPSVTRAAQDAFAAESHRRAVAAHAAGYLQRELIAVEAPAGKTTVRVDADEQPRPDSTLEALAKLRPAFRKDGSVTAGNSSSLNDGSAALLLCSEAALARYGWQPLARVVATANAGVDPRTMGIGPVPAIRKLLERTGWALAAIDAVELNEAFAAQSLAVLAELPFDPARVNIDGGAIAIGHPLGCSGARIAGHLVHLLQRTQGRRGVASLCVGVGQGVATAFERV
ncbi:MAG: acetyl-CoA C-acyltransferase [Deltaproteobacteria bacterium]|nr:acetyl-CoA C-acyltransferase [Deltaproteobacteria bacterium]